MKMNIYLDVFFLLNFIVDFCLMYSCGMILRCNQSVGNTMLASFFGSVIACGWLLVGLRGNIFTIASIGVRLFTATGMVYLSYGKNDVKSFLREIICLYFSCFALEGLIYFTNSMWGMVLLIGISFFVGHEKKKRQNIIRVTLLFKGKSIVLKGFYDTGNRLAEPVTGRMVHIATYDSVKKIFPKSYRQIIEHYFETGLLEGTKVTELQMYEFTFLSYHSIGKETGELLGIRMDLAVYETGTGKKTEEKAVIALTNQRKLLGNHCQIIINGRLEI